jgi:molybdopterin-guanine dinucleotide biosynthesis protein B
MANRPLPMIGFVAPSGTGKTTLLRKLVPVLRERGLRLAYLKHTHHAVELDTPGKDSFEIAGAGAEQVMLASNGGWTLMDRRADGEPNLQQLAAQFDAAALDLLLVEGFHHSRYPKIEVYRSTSGKPPLYPDDGDIIAVVTDSQLPGSEHPLELPIEDPRAVADFIVSRLADQRFSGEDPLEQLIGSVARMRAEGAYPQAASVRIGDRFWITPAALDGVLYRENLRGCSVADAAADTQPEPVPESVSGTDDEGAALALAIHRKIYQQQSSTGAILQVSGPHAMAVAFAGRDFQPVDAEGERRLGSVPVLSIDAAEIDKAAAKIAETLADYPLCLVAGHGAYIRAAELEQTLRLAERLEHSATIYVIARQITV